MPAAAALLIAIASPLIYRSVVRERPAPADETIRGAEIQPIAPAGPVADVREFQWQSPIQAVRYRVSVYRGAERIWFASSETPRLILSAPIVLERGVEYTWAVEAVDQEGQVRLTSPRLVFSLRP